MTQKAQKRIKRDPERTRTALLNAGIELFSSRGYDGVSVDEIVAHAGFNKRMLYHYFENKDGLYVEVLRHVFAKLEACEIKSVENASDTKVAIKEILARYFDFLQQNPDFVNLLLWENLNQARFIDAHPNILSKAPILERLGEIIQQGIKQGEIDKSVDARHLLILLIGVCFIYFSNRHTLRHSFNLDLNRPSILNQGLQLAQNVMINGLIKPDTSGKR
ncbi:TetR/AcrR family transcriptional regulator [Ruficoccus amylovorans]|uniref:TetR/AcrR family transcriptional regulator n=1 Tax=Ruficoccus amylovorans TaxID=1804625 RepID=A0A842HGR4_9BACT|nr:TetR/AcrR family transcriptional regulator [Ruficoccus amylovorans]MBC2595713.1 TetR/AcrR family transcriptional regulator [Ruficoccus amylovorans]